MAGAMITLKNVDKSFGKNKVLEKINFSIRKGTFTVILGASGSGKTTLLRLIAGLDFPTDGKIFINGKDVTNEEASKRNISMVFQSYALFPHMNVRENIVFGLKVRKVKKKEIEKRLSTVTKMLKIDNLLNRKPSELSGGQRQRVALARAIISERPICLMDEPLSNLDAKLRSSMRKELKSLQEKLNLTVIYVTHDQIEAMSMADEIILINNGKIEQHADPKTIYENPETIYVAEFIGTPPMNIFSINLIKNFNIKLPENAEKAGVRPESISFERREIKIGDGEIVFCEYHGSETIYSVKVNETLINVKSIEGKHTIGEKISLYCNREQLHFFNREGRKL